jgi:hypothetical protein
MPDRLTHPYLLLVLTTLFWSGNMVIGRAFRDQVPPFSLAFWRWAIALALVLPLALPHLRAQGPLLRQHWQAVTILGLLGIGGYNTLAYIGLQYTPGDQRRPAELLHPDRHHHAVVDFPQEALAGCRVVRCAALPRRRDVHRLSR